MRHHVPPSSVGSGLTGCSRPGPPHYARTDRCVVVLYSISHWPWNGWWDRSGWVIHRKWTSGRGPRWLRWGKRHRRTTCPRPVGTGREEDALVRSLFSTTQFSLGFHTLTFSNLAERHRIYWANISLLTNNSSYNLSSASPIWASWPVTNTSFTLKTTQRDRFYDSHFTKEKNWEVTSGPW